VREPSSNWDEFAVASVNILRTLWRLRAFVALVAVLALLAGWALAYRFSFPLERRSYSVGIANANVLIDTPKSQVVDVEPRGSDTLGSRANVIANLMVDGQIKDAIAHRAGIPGKRLVAFVDSPDTPGPPLTAKSLSYKTSAALTSDMSQLPIVKVETQAPTVAEAIHLANAAVAGLGDYLNSTAAAETISDTRRLRVNPLGTAQGQEAARGPGRMMAVGVMVFVFFAGCAAILTVAAIVLGWRVAAGSEGAGETEVADESAHSDEHFEAGRGRDALEPTATV
jgi:hypothetical protein